MPAKTLDIKGLAETIEAIEQSPEVAVPILSQKMEQSLLLIEGLVKEYPPQPRRDRAKTFNTYVRGKGRYPRSYFPGGQFNARAGRRLKKRGKVHLVSERLGTKWTHKVSVRKDQVIEGVLGNSASYAGYVQIKDDPEGDVDQTDFHAATGWPTLEDSIDQVEPEIDKLFDQGADEILRKLGFA